MYGPVNEISVLITLSSNEGAGKPVQIDRLARALLLAIYRYNSQTRLKRPLKKTKNWFSGPINAGQKYCRMLYKSILQYFRPSFSYHLSLRSLFCPFLSGCL